MRLFAVAFCLLALGVLASSARATEPIDALRELIRARAHAHDAEASARLWRRRYQREHRANRYHATRVRELQRTLRHRDDVDEAIGLAAAAHDVSRAELDRKAWCESRKRARAKNRRSSATGLFQILFPSTWRTTPFARFSPWSPYASANAAAWMIAHGRRHEWVCQ